MVFSFLPRRWFASGRLSINSLYWNILLSNLLLLLLGALLANTAFSENALTQWPGFCLVQRLIGLPCPGCGITRGMLCTLRGDFGAALHYNPVSLLLLAFMLFQTASAAFTLIKGRGTQPLLRSLQVPVLLSLLLFWAYQVLYTG